MTTRTDLRDHVIRGHAFRVKTGNRGMRAIREAALALAFGITEGRAEGGYLVLVDPAVSPDRLRQEWKLLLRVMAPGLRPRLGALVFQDGAYTPIQGSIPDWVVGVAATLAEPPPASENRVALKAPDYFFVVLKILLRQWLLGQGPMTTKALIKDAGCSYPTAAAALLRLQPSLRRHSDRKIALKRFPTQAWSQLLAFSGRARSTLRFADRSGQPQSPVSLRRRLRGLGVEGIAVGGTSGARHWYPDLDLAGDPRLDLTIHCPARDLDYAFLTSLDPALAIAADPSEPALIVIHVLRRATPFYAKGAEGEVWADPVECLLDLHELRLESQARSYLAHLRAEAV